MILIIIALAVQNERQPRNTAQIRHDQLGSDMEQPMIHSSATVSATHPAFQPVVNHRFMTNIIAGPESTAKHDMEDGGKYVIRHFFQE